MLTDLKSRGPTPHHTSASAGGILNHGGTLILNASKVGDNTAAEEAAAWAPASLVVNFSQVNSNTAYGHDEAGGEARARADLHEVIRSPHTEDQSPCPGPASVAVRLGWRWNCDHRAYR